MEQIRRPFGLLREFLRLSYRLVSNVHMGFNVYIFGNFSEILRMIRADT